jgi:hypothetical protein
MNRFLISAAMIGALAMPTAAAADELPSFYLGMWCVGDSDGDETVYSRPEKESPCQEVIFAPRVAYGIEHTCRLKSIRRGVSWPPATKTPKKEWIPSVKISGWCHGENDKYKIELELHVVKGGDVVARDTSPRSNRP